MRVFKIKSNFSVFIFIKDELLLIFNETNNNFKKPFIINNTKIFSLKINYTNIKLRTFFVV